MTCANYLGYACSCGGECLEMAKVQIGRIRLNHHPVSEWVPVPSGFTSRCI